MPDRPRNRQNKPDSGPRRLQDLFHVVASALVFGMEFTVASGSFFSFSEDRLVALVYEATSTGSVDGLSSPLSRMRNMM